MKKKIKNLLIEKVLYIARQCCFEQAKSTIFTYLSSMLSFIKAKVKKGKEAKQYCILIFAQQYFLHKLGDFCTRISTRATS
jgi:hypothetical protein